MNPLASTSSGYPFAGATGGADHVSGNTDDEEVVMRRREPAGARTPRPEKEIMVNGRFDANAAPIRSHGASITVLPGAVVLGPHCVPAIKSAQGTITIRGATIHGDVETRGGRILVSEHSRVEGCLQDYWCSGRPREMPAIRVEDAEVTGEIYASQIELINASVDKVSLHNHRQWNPEEECRLDLQGDVRLNEIEVEGRCLVVTQAPLPAGLRINGGPVAHLDLSLPLTLEALVSGTQLPSPRTEFSWDDWHVAQHALERLCMPALSRFQHLPAPTDWLPWVEHLQDSGQRLAKLFGGWMEAHPARLLQGVKAQPAGGVARACAALGLALLARDPSARTGVDRSLLREVAAVARERGVRWQAVHPQMLQLQGLTSQGMPLLQRVGANGDGSGRPGRSGGGNAPSMRALENLPAYLAEFRDQL